MRQTDAAPRAARNPCADRTRAALRRVPRPTRASRPCDRPGRANAERSPQRRQRIGASTGSARSCLRQLAAVGIEHQRQVRVARRAAVRAAALQQDLARRRVEQVGAAHDVGDALRRIVDDDGELVGPPAVGAPQRRNRRHRARGPGDAALDRVVERDDACRRARAAGSPDRARDRAPATQRAMHAVDAARSLRLQWQAKASPLASRRSSASRYCGSRVLCRSTGASDTSPKRSSVRSCASAAPATSRGGSRSSIRTSHSPPAWRANSQLPNAATSEPKCSGPVGEGAKRPR